METRVMDTPEFTLPPDDAEAAYREWRAEGYGPDEDAESHAWGRGGPGRANKNRSLTSIVIPCSEEE